MGIWIISLYISCIYAYIYTHTHIHIYDIYMGVVFLSVSNGWYKSNGFHCFISYIEVCKNKAKNPFIIDYVSIVYFRLQYLCIEYKTLKKGTSTD